MIVTACRFRPEHKRLRCHVFIRIIQQVEILRHDFEHVHQLPFVFVQPFYLRIHAAVGVKNEARRFLDVCGKRRFALMLDFRKLREYLLVVGIF